MTDDLPRTLLDIARSSMAPDHPQPVERLGPIVPGRVPRDHVHHWVPGVTVGDSRTICRDCGQWENTKS